MNKPFILFDDGDVSLFRSLEALGAYVESPDVAGYLATDAQGRIVHFAPTVDSQTPICGLVRVAKVVATIGSDRLDQSEFYERLRGFLRGLSVGVNDTAPLEELLRQVEHQVGYSA